MNRPAPLLSPAAPGSFRPPGSSPRAGGEAAPPWSEGNKPGPARRPASNDISHTSSAPAAVPAAVPPASGLYTRAPGPPSPCGPFLCQPAPTIRRRQEPRPPSPPFIPVEYISIAKRSARRNPARSSWSRPAARGRSCRRSPAADTLLYISPPLPGSSPAAVPAARSSAAPGSPRRRPAGDGAAAAAADDPRQVHPAAVPRSICSPPAGAVPAKLPRARVQRSPPPRPPSGAAADAAAVAAAVAGAMLHRCRGRRRPPDPARRILHRVKVLKRYCASLRPSSGCVRPEIALENTKIFVISFSPSPHRRVRSIVGF